MNVDKIFLLVCLFAAFAKTNGLYRNVYCFNINRPGLGFVRFPMPPTQNYPMAQNNELPKPIDYKPVYGSLKWTHTPSKENYKIVFFLVPSEIFYNLFEPSSLPYLRAIKKVAWQRYIRFTSQGEVVEQEAETSKKGKEPAKTEKTKYIAYIISANEIPIGNAKPIVQWIEAHHNSQATNRHPTEYIEIVPFGFGSDIFSVSKPNTKYPDHDSGNSNIANIIYTFLQETRMTAKFKRVHVLHVSTLQSISHEIKIPANLEYSRTAYRTKEKFIYPPTFKPPHQFYEKPYGGDLASFYEVDSILWRKIILELQGEQIGPNLKILHEKAEMLRTTNQTYVYIVCFSGYNNPLQEMGSEFLTMHRRLDEKIIKEFTKYTAIHDVSISGHRYIDRYGQEFNRIEFDIIPIIEKFKPNPDINLEPSPLLQPAQNSNASQVPKIQIQSDEDVGPKPLVIYETIQREDYKAHKESMKRKFSNLEVDEGHPAQSSSQSILSANTQYLHPSSAASMDRFKRHKRE